MNDEAFFHLFLFIMFFILRSSFYVPTEILEKIDTSDLKKKHSCVILKIYILYENIQIINQQNLIQELKVQLDD